MVSFCQLPTSKIQLPRAVILEVGAWELEFGAICSRLRFVCEYFDSSQRTGLTLKRRTARWISADVQHVRDDVRVLHARQRTRVVLRHRHPDPFEQRVEVLAFPRRIERWPRQRRSRLHSAKAVAMTHRTLLGVHLGAALGLLLCVHAVPHGLLRLRAHYDCCHEYCRRHTQDSSHHVNSQLTNSQLPKSRATAYRL